MTAWRRLRDLAPLPVLVVGVWLLDNAVRDRRAVVRALAERAERLEKEHELEMRVAVADERMRIARELQDVVAHSVSVMVVQAGAARRLLQRRPERVADALLSVESTGREALTELRRLLGPLTDRDGRAALTPPPGLAELDALVERLARAGLQVDVRVEGAPRALPPGLDVTVYRIVQEALTNVIEHAGGAHTEVVVRYRDQELELEVLDAGGGDAAVAMGAGRGLLGMRERAALYGGELEAGPRPEGGFAVRARLPVETA